MQKCWVDELLDAVFNITDVVSIPDDLILKVSKEWAEALRDGYLSCVTWDKTRTAYLASYIYAQFLSDLGVLMNLHSIAYQIAVKENVYGNLDIEDMIKAADTKMYQDKEKFYQMYPEGRNGALIYERVVE